MAKMTLKKVLLASLFVGISLCLLIYFKQPGFYVCTCQRQPECIHQQGIGEAASKETTPYGEKYNNGNSSFIIAGRSDFQDQLKQSELEGFICVKSKK